MTSPPQVSVVMPVFDGARHLRPAVDSVLAQTHGDLELLVVDDGSTDDTPAILAAVDDPRLHVLRQPHLGLVEALNRGLAAARGEYVARMDADDLCLPRRLAAQVRFLDRHPRVAVVGCWFAHLDEEGRQLNDAVQLPRLHEGIWRAMLAGEMGLLHPTVLLRRQVLDHIGGYDAAFRHSEDVELFSRILARHRAANLPEVLYLWRIRRSSVCTARRATQRSHERLLRHMLWRALLTGRCSPTARERRRARARGLIEESPRGQRAAEAAYLNRVGYALLAGGHRREARRRLGESIVLDPARGSAYLGWIRAATARWTSSTSM